MMKTQYAKPEIDIQTIEWQNYWLRKLTDDLETTGIKRDYHYTPGHIRKRVSFPIQFTTDLNRSLLHLANGKDFLLYTVLMATLNISLHKYSGKNRIVIGSPLLKKEDGVEPAENVIAIVNSIDRNQSFRDFLLAVRKNLLDDYEKQRYPFASLLSALNFSGTTEKCQLFDLALALTNIHEDLPEVNHEMTLTFTNHGESISGHIEYDGNIFRQETVAEFMGYMLNILEKALTDPNVRLAELQIFTEKQFQQLFVQWNDTQIPYRKDICIHQLIEDQSQKTPDATAVVVETQKITYRELNRKANQLAGYLRKSGVKPNDLVGICIEPSPEMVVGLLGILKAGAAYVPIDPKYPQDRISFMVTDANPAVVVTKKRLIERLPQLGPKMLMVDGEWDQIAQENGENNTFEGISVDNLAYIIYTSGSTGTPKGSGVYQKGWHNLLHWFINEFQLKATDKTLLISSFSFDLTQKNIFAPLIIGGELHLMPGDYYDPGRIAQVVLAQGITWLNCTPSAFYPLVDREDSFEKLQSLRYLFLGGEPISLPRFANWAKANDYRTEVVNTYGPTECTDICASYRIQKTDFQNLGSVPVGKPIYNTSLFILNQNDDPVPPGMPGELCIAGDGVGCGYIRDAGLTAAKFIRRPFGRENDELIYKTGDLTTYLPDGNILYLGRMDHQVKIRGFRIELGEIESLLKQHPAVEEAVVLVRESSSGDQKLEAFVVPDRQTAPVVKRLAKMEQDGISGKLQSCDLPNGMTVFHLNQSETQFVYREIFEEQTYLQQGIRLNDGSTVLDVGANIGLFALFVGMTFQDTKIYAFEPIAPIYEVLKHNVDLYDLPVEIINCGLSDEPRFVDMVYYPHVSIMSGRYADREDDHQNIIIAITRELMEQEVAVSESEIDKLIADRLRSEVYHCELKTVSDMIRERHLTRIDLLKIDVEKSELDILKGIMDEDWAKIQQIVLELHDLDGRLAEVRTLLESKGYDVAYCKDAKLEDNDIYNLYARLKRDEGDGKSEQTIHAKRQWWKVRTMVEEIRTLAKEKLPEYMVPSNVIVLEKIPLTPNGKIDREALIAYSNQYQQKNNNNMVVPVNPLEMTIARLWADILDMQSISTEANFIELGGHSLLATAIIAKLRKIYAVELPIIDFFENPTIKKQALVLQRLIDEAAAGSSV